MGRTGFESLVFVLVVSMFGIGVGAAIGFVLYSIACGCVRWLNEFGPVLLGIILIAVIVVGGFWVCGFLD